MTSQFPLCFLPSQCQQVQTDLLPLSSNNGGPLDVCRTIANYILPMLSMPPLTVFKSNRPVAKVSRCQILFMLDLWHVITSPTTVHVCVRARACVCVCVCACVCVRARAHIRRYTTIHIYMQPYGHRHHTHIFARTHARTHAHLYITTYADTTLLRPLHKSYHSN